MHAPKSPESRQRAVELARLRDKPVAAIAKDLEPEVAVFAVSHPSPTSVQRTAGAQLPFSGSDPFRKVNRCFESRSVEPIDWTIVD